MRIGVISDHLSTTTGFKVATKPFVEGFLEQGWDVHYLGVVGQDMPWDDDRITMTPTDGTPLVKDGVLREWIIRTAPDIIFAVRDPGTVVDWSVGPQSISGVLAAIKDGHINMRQYKVVYYMPIEGIPLSRTFRLAFELPIWSGGKVVFYTETAMNVSREQFPWIGGHCEFVHHGLDHFPENNYSPEDRLLLKEMAGMSERLVVMTIGTNKRTKGLAETIYTASAYKQMYGSKDVIFYIHTEPEDPIIGGHDLIHLRHQYNVEDIVVFKPTSNLSARKNVLAGVETEGERSLIEGLRKLKDVGFTPEEPEEALSNLRQYKFTDLFAMSDLYLDLSQLEGWGLPVGEAMQWGLPVMGISDRAVRDEVYGNSRIVIQSEDMELWDTFGSGARLAKGRPSTVATMIHSVVEDKTQLDQATIAGKQCASRYKWGPSVEKMVDIIKECYGTG